MFHHALLKKFNWFIFVLILLLNLIHLTSVTIYSSLYSPNDTLIVCRERFSYSFSMNLLRYQECYLNPVAPATLPLWFCLNSSPLPLFENRIQNIQGTEWNYELSAFVASQRRRREKTVAISTFLWTELNW